MPQPEVPSASLVSGEIVELEIERLASGGDGVAHARDGRVVFVPRTAPGDRVRARVTEARRRFVRAELEEICEPGPDRCEPRCPVYADCGGCSWQHLGYAAQCAAKLSIVTDALRRIGGLALDRPLALTPSPEAYGYRARARVGRLPDAVGYRRRSSNQLCAVDSCPVLVPQLDARLRGLADDLRAQPSSRGSRRTPLPEDWELVADATAGRARPAGAASAPGFDGEPVLLDVAGDAMRVSPGVFFQANVGLHAALLAAVLREAGTGPLAVDLFAGAGFFTLSLARRFERVVAVESHPGAVADLRHNLSRAALDNVDVVGARVEDGWHAGVASSLAGATVVLDPPRTGLAADGLSGLLAVAPERIVYVSCDPATLARDLRGVIEAGYGLDHVEAFDLFPQTAHVEVLARLTRSGPVTLPASA